ncbi:hypothetical protein B0T20DRAFT_425831 [Sordaria brevicollis]|uniref:Uncharacterized protein n=1 Tax=Sordaria brevicollis TaxID=83679 RepID=A0AAE0NVP0_SORBR|nr:hypothetical protein B0T20DRAFT_425831 [Sordaria brevicollis]
MVSLKFAAFATLAAFAVAAPTTAVSSAGTEEIKPFSFSQWVDDILNPNVIALTPEQAVDAYYQSVNATDAAAAPEAGSLNKRAATCRTISRALIADAVSMINQMAARGQATHTFSIQATLIDVRDGLGVQRASIGATGGGGARSYTVPWESYARAGGFVMDACTYGTTTGGQAQVPGDFGAGYGVQITLSGIYDGF